jgi:hypothetical protein
VAEFTNIKWVPVIIAWRILRLWMEEQPPVRRVAAYTLNKQAQTANEGWTSSLGVGQRLLTIKIYHVMNNSKMP